MADVTAGSFVALEMEVQFGKIELYAAYLDECSSTFPGLI